MDGAFHPINTLIPKFNQKMHELIEKFNFESGPICVQHTVYVQHNRVMNLSIQLYIVPEGRS